jgi:hypothetical protein
MNRLSTFVCAFVALGPLALASRIVLTGAGGNIPDPSGTPGAWNVQFTGSAFQSSVVVPGPVARVTALRLNGFHHSWRGDVHAYLRDPSGTKHNLIVRPGFSGTGAGDYGDFVLGDFALVPTGGATLQQNGANLVTGDYAPYFNAGSGRWTNGMNDTPLVSIQGPAGAWTLVIEDWANMDTGGLASWTLEGETVEPSHAFCGGDGVDPDVTTACPCGNFGALGRGCANSIQPLGAELTAAGQANPDSMVLVAQGMPANAPVLFLQSDGLGDTTWGDGVRCLGASLVRLRMKQGAGGSAQYPDIGEQSLSVRGNVTPGSGAVRHYQGYYRNAAATFCPPATANVTNGWTLIW